MKIGVVSDTHSKGLPKSMLEDFKAVDLILHAGDFCDLADYDVLAKIKDVRAVHGNMDTAAICGRFPRRQIVDCAGYKIGLFHGEGAPANILDVVKKQFAKDKVDVVVFGHSHQAFNEKIDGVHYFNPGSPNDDVFAPYCSYGLLDLSEKGVKATIVKIRK